MNETRSGFDRVATVFRERVLATPGAWVSWRAKRFWAVVALLLYTLVGFVIVPWVGRHQIESGLSEALQRPVELRELRVNPFVLSVEATGFAIAEANGDPLVGFERLFVNFQLFSLFRWAWTFKEITLEQPNVRFARFDDGTTNFGRLASEMADPEPQQPVEPDADEGGLVRLVIGEFNLLEGQGEYIDETPETDFSVPVGPITAVVHDISTLPEAQGKQQVSIYTELGSRIAWNGSLSLDPLHSAGHLEASGPFLPITYRYFQDLVTVTVTQGDVELSLDYEFGLDADSEITAAIDNLDYALREVSVVQEDIEIVQLSEVRLQGGRMRYPDQVVSASRLSISKPQFQAWQDADGEFNVNRILRSPATDPVQPAAEPTEAAESGTPMSDWTLSLDEFEISDLTFKFEDRALRTPGAVEVSDLDLVLNKLSNTPGAKFPFDLSVALASGGGVKTAGQVGALPELSLESRVTLDDLAVGVLQPYVADVVAVTIDSGLLRGSSEVTFDVDSGIDAAGALSFVDLSVADAANQERLVGWEEIAIDRYVFTGARTKLEISEVDIVAPYVRLLIEPDRTTNFTALVLEDEAAPAQDAGNTGETETTETAPEPEDGGVFDLTIARVEVNEGSADFTDLALPLPFRAKIKDLQGELTTLATASSEPAQVRLEGQIDDYGLARIRGSLMPLGPTEQTDIELLFRNVNLPDMTPYTIEFAGREIADGRMELDLRYKVEKGVMQGQNSLVISDLQLGDEVESPDAFDLPLGLAVALLKGPDGKIDFDVPVEGDVNDPEFRLGGVIAKAIFNVLTRIVTSPFRLLGSLVGVESEDFDVIDFEPGVAELTPPEEEKVAKLVEALNLRPQLGLELPAVFDPEADAAALRTRMIAERIEQGLAQQDSAQDVMLATRRRQVLEAMMAADLPAVALENLQASYMKPEDPAEPEGSQVLDESAYVADLQKQLEAAAPVGEPELRALGDARTSAVSSRLVGESGIAEERVVVVSDVNVEMNDAGWVPMKLEVSTR